MELETVEIVNPAAPSGFTRINKSDFDPATMQLVGEAKPKAERQRKGGSK
jgi:hypothetical protein